MGGVEREGWRWGGGVRGVIVRCWEHIHGRGVKTDERFLNYIRGRSKVPLVDTIFHTNTQESWSKAVLDGPPKAERLLLFAGAGRHPTERHATTGAV